MTYQKKNPTNKGEKPFWRGGSAWVLWVAGAALFLSFVVSQLIIVNARVVDRSMEPTLRHGDMIVASRLAYGRESPKRGDIILFRKEELEADLIVKRIAGLPGERVEIRNGYFLVDGQVQSHMGQFSGDMEALRIPENAYFVLGDNREASHDSRNWEEPFVERDTIRGKVLLRYFPDFAQIK